MTPMRLIWPPRELHPNARAHWRKRAPITKQYRGYAAAVARTTGLQAPDGRIAVDLTFCPPDNRRRDLDGMQAAMKAGLDGIADGLGINDRMFRPRSDWGKTDPAGAGFVLVDLAPWEKPS